MNWFSRTASKAEMNAGSALPTRDLVLLGIGHTNSHILRMWMMNPIQDVQLTCLSNYSIATYSGMLPAVLAGQCAPEKMEVDLVKLCAAAGARLVQEPVVGLEPDSRLIHFSDRPPMHYSVLSIGIGSVPDLPPRAASIETPADSGPVADQASVELSLRALAIKPMQTFLQRLTQSVLHVADQAKAQNRASPMRIAVVGSGAAGVEISSCIRGFLEKHGVPDYQISLVSRSEQILSGSNARLARKTASELKRRGINVVSAFEVANYDWSPNSNALHLHSADREKLEFDLVIWATGATAPPLLRELGLATDDRGFLRVDETLTCVGQSGVFAVGDTASMPGAVPKAGVYAVRQGPILWKNLHRYLANQQLLRYQPQKGFLKLLNFGDGQTALEWKGLVTAGKWPWRLKKWIDESFLEKHTPPPMDTNESMQCSGCGCKLDAISLEASLRTSLVDKNLPAVSSGDWSGSQAEDAAEIGDGFLASVDFFTPPVPDPYTSGRLLALHAGSDLLAVGARPYKALATVTVPETISEAGVRSGGTSAQSRWLSELLAGIRRELGRSDAVLAGGHTIVGPRAEIGLTMIGRINSGRVLGKDTAQAGDDLVLLKPLGIGTVMAAWHRSLCSARHWDAALATMLQPQHVVLELLEQFTIHSMTDVTGFGLAGHLLEMMTQSGVKAELEFGALHMLPGAIELCRNGVRSSLFESNRAAALPRCEFARSAEEHDLLFDPQTCGGLLVSLPSHQAKELVAAAHHSGLHAAAKIGTVVPQSGDALISVS